MGNIIMLEKATVLYSSNFEMNYFHNVLAEIAKNENLTNKELLDFISSLDQNIYWGCADREITEEIHSIENMRILQKLVEKTIDKIKQDKNCAQVSIDKYENFNKELIKWLESK